jgi:hypothetical protein
MDYEQVNRFEEELKKQMIIIKRIEIEIKLELINIEKRNSINENKIKKNKSDSNEVQKHGFIWEENICKCVYGTTDEEYNNIPYTYKTDLPSKYNHLNNVDIAIKTTGTFNTVCMSDPKNLYKKVDTYNKFHLCVLIYKQIDKDIKKLEQIIEINLTNSRKKLFGDNTLNDIMEYEEKIKSIAKNRHPTKQENEELDILQDNLQKKSGVIKFNRKIDSKTQRRLQCSFNKFQDFIKNNKEIIIAQSNNNIFRGCKIINEIKSAPRKFN